MEDNYFGSGVLIKKAVKKYGTSAFIREVICEEKSRSLIEELEELIVDESFIANENTYNLITGGYGKVPSDETREKMSKSATGRKASSATKSIMSLARRGEGNSRYGVTLSEETKEKISKSLLGKFSGDKNPFYGKNHTDESKLKISLQLKGKYTGEDSGFFGRHHTQETKDLISKANSGENNVRYGVKLSEEECKAISDRQKGESNSFYGKTHSAEAKAKMSLKRKGQTLSKEHKLKIGLAQKGRKQPVITCPFCGKEGGVSNMKRWHFDNCKLKEV